MVETILKIDGKQAIDTLKEINGFLDEIIPKIERLRGVNSNFVTLNPTVNITPGTDIGEVVKRIEKTLEEEINASKVGEYRVVSKEERDKTQIDQSQLPDLCNVEDEIIHIFMKYKVWYSDVDAIFKNVREKTFNSLIKKESFDFFK